MTLIDLLAVAYLAIGLSLAIVWTVTMWQSRDPVLFLISLIAAAFIPVFWAPLAALFALIGALVRVTRWAMGAEK
jgi:hypothetical protein